MVASLPEIEEKIRSLAAGITESEGLELVDLEFRLRGRKWFLRVIIGGPIGVNAEDCARVSRQLGPVLDVEDFIPHRYTLEVSSPGLDRPLVKEVDFRRNIGKLVRVRTRGSMPAQQEFRGKIIGIDPGGIILEQEGKGDIQIPFVEIKDGKLLIDWKKAAAPEGKRKG